MLRLIRLNQSRRQRPGCYRGRDGLPGGCELSLWAAKSLSQAGFPGKQACEAPGSTSLWLVGGKSYQGTSCFRSFLRAHSLATPSIDRLPRSAAFWINGSANPLAVLAALGPLDAPDLHSRGYDWQRPGERQAALFRQRIAYRACPNAPGVPSSRRARCRYTLSDPRPYPHRDRQRAWSLGFDC